MIFLSCLNVGFVFTFQCVIENNNCQSVTEFRSMTTECVGLEVVIECEARADKKLCGRSH